MEEKEKTLNEEFKEKIEKQIKKMISEDINLSNVDTLYKLEDIKKDILQEQMMEKESEDMYNGDYSAYGRRGVPGTGRRYRRYRGEDALDEMKYHYGNYMESGNNYGAKDDSSYKMIEALEKFIFAVGEELEPIDIKTKYHCLIVKPQKGLSTKAVYEITDNFERENIDTPKILECLKKDDLEDDLLHKTAT